MIINNDQLCEFLEKHELYDTTGFSYINGVSKGMSVYKEKDHEVCTYYGLMTTDGKFDGNGEYELLTLNPYIETIELTKYEIIEEVPSDEERENEADMPGGFN